MNNYKEVEGDLIKLSLQGAFDVITHCTNCFCTQKAGIAPQMVKAFGTDRFKMEAEKYRGSMNKLGTIDYESGVINNGIYLHYSADASLKILTVINTYGQFGMGYDKNGKPPVDYEALTLCMRKINFTFKDKHIGLPGLICCGLAGGDETIVKAIIKKELKDMQITIVYLPGMLKPDVSITKNKQDKTEISTGDNLFGAQG